MYSTVDELLEDKATLDKIDGVIICTGHSVRTLTLALTLTLASTRTLTLNPNPNPNPNGVLICAGHALLAQGGAPPPWP